MELLLAALVGGFVVWLALRRRGPAVTTSATAAAPPRRSGPGVFGWLAIIGGAGIVGIWMLGSMAPADRSEASKWASPASSPAADPYDQTGCSASRRAIEARLRSPASAKWVSCRVTTTAGVQTVTLTVDSQNAMGALLRSEWVTTVRNNNVESITQAR